MPFKTLLTALGCIIALNIGAYAANGSNNDSRVYTFGGRTYVDSSLLVSGAIQGDKYTELVSISTPTTPATNHARLFLNGVSKQICAVFDNGNAGCISASNVNSVVGGLGINASSSGGITTIGISTPIANASIDASSVTKQGNLFNGNSQLVQTNTSGQLPAISGVNVTSLNASNLASGTVPDAQLSSNVVLLGSTQTLTSQKTFKNTLIISTSIALGSLGSVGTSGQVLTSGGSAGTPTWATAASVSGATILQSSTVYVAVSSCSNTTTLEPTNTAITLTPASTNSRIEISASGTLQTANGSIASIYASVFRGTTNLATLNNSGSTYFCNGQANSAIAENFPCTLGPLMDLPSTTSAVTYTVYIKNDGNSSVCWNKGLTGTATAVITAKEYSQ